MWQLNKLKVDITRYVIPILFRNDRLEAKKRRKQWVDFVKAKRAKQSRLGPSRSSLICFMHFKPDDFVRRLDFQEEEGISLTSWFKQDEFGKTAFIDLSIRCSSVMCLSIRCQRSRQRQKAGE